MSAIVYAPLSYSHLRAVVREAIQAARLPLWLCAAQAIVAYEWLISGVNRLLYPWLSAHVPAMLQQGMQNTPYGWYVTFLRSLMLPPHTQSGRLLTWSEASVGAILLLSALLWAACPESRLTARMAWAACLALAAATALSLSDYLLSAHGLPGITPLHAYAGVGRDAVLLLAGLALLRANVRALARLRRLYR